MEIKNRRASYEYHLSDKYIAGMVLTGTEIKSIREGKMNFADAYCLFLRDGLYVRQLHISEFKFAGHYNHDPVRDRKLLLNKKELGKLQVKTKEKGYTIVPVRLFFSESGFAKLEIALAKGKKLYDKRDDLKTKDAKREMKE